MSKLAHLLEVAEQAIASGDKTLCATEWQYINDQCNYAKDSDEYLAIEALAVRVYKASK